MSHFFSHLSEHFYENLRRKLTYANDLGKFSFQDIWDGRQLYRLKFLQKQDQLIERKMRLFD